MRDNIYSGGDLFCNGETCKEIDMLLKMDRQLVDLQGVVQEISYNGLLVIYA